MTKSQKLENRLNKIKKYETYVVFTRGHKFFIQDLRTGNIEREFWDSEELEQFIVEREEEERRWEEEKEDFE